MRTSQATTAHTTSRHASVGLAITGLMIATSVAGCVGSGASPLASATESPFDSSPSATASPSGDAYAAPSQSDWSPPVDVSPTPSSSAWAGPTASPNFTVTGSMTVPRSGHSATQLNDGTVLIAGGMGNPSTAQTNGVMWATAELYDPVTGKFKATGSMSEARSGHMATLLKNGRVLIVGGYGDNGVLASAELYDPATGKFTETGSMSKARDGAVEALLPDGRVLVAGGQADSTNKDASLASAEIYDPAKGTFSPTGSMETARAQPAATNLNNGRILIAGGGDISAELYDPTTGKFTATGSMSHDLVDRTATLLKDGRVLVAGGAGNCRKHSDADHACVEVEREYAELYDPATGKFVSTGSMTEPRFFHTATLLNDGRVLIAGGCSNATGCTPKAELYDPSTGRFGDAGTMGASRYGQTATLLASGLVLIAGGIDAGGDESFSAAELFRP